MTQLESVCQILQKKNNILLMVCDQCAVRRNLAEGTLEQCGSGDVKAKGLVDGVVAGCFPTTISSIRNKST